MRFHKYIILSLLSLLGAFAPGWASDATTAESKSIVVLGDSLTAGYGLDPTQAFPAVVQKKIDESGLKFNVVNAGVSGDTSAGGLRRLDWLLKRKVDVLVIALGGNDGLRGLSPRAMRQNLQTIVDRTREKYPEAQIVIAGMRMPANLGDYAAEFGRVFPELARENKLALVPFLLEGVGGKPELNLPDQIHPTAEGQKIIAENVWAILKPLLALK
ncbi:MAG: arylesterase [Acidobacteriales bacterium]|nr:arylesterase [Terriglobales bacterium]